MSQLDGVLGYLNFSAGKADPRFQKQLSDAYEILAGQGAAQPWQALAERLRARLGELRQAGSAAFRESAQAEGVLALVFDCVLPAYRRHHANLLFHQSEQQLFQPFFLARVFEAVLSQGGPWMEAERITAGALAQLNDFVGHRPVATLERRDTAEIYDHEKVRPIPLYLRGAGVAAGPYRDLIARALEILERTDREILAEAAFDPALLDELALDPRSYDHSHPANKRSNYVFGEWDPHHLDRQGRFRRYVVRQVTLDGLLEWARRPGDHDPQEALAEAAAVLAGTVLMATGVSGWGPGAYDSSTTLATLIPRIARYRDAFYARLLETFPPAHAARLRAEAERTHQPFGIVRQHLNQFIARQRAAQVQDRHLSLLLAAMGYPEASRRQAARIPAASTRLLSEIHSRLTAGAASAQAGRLHDAAAVLPEVEELIRGGIACGALADPWNILGFQGLYPLDRAREDSVRDTRVDDLIAALERLFDLGARLQSEAAAAGDRALAGRVAGQLRRLASWWDRYASIEVSDVRRLHGAEAADSAQHVADALALWHERGEAAADLAFWRDHLNRFRSPKAFALVIDALLDKKDARAAMALLMSWLGQAEQVPLEDGEYSFHTRALRWMLSQTVPQPDTRPADPWPLVRKFFDYLEANAEEYGQVPSLEAGPEELPPPRAKEDDVFGAAYEGMTYRDTADDDQEGPVAEGGPDRGSFALDWQAESLEKRLRFLATLARLWQIAARADSSVAADRAETLGAWLATARQHRQRLLGLLDALHDLAVPRPIGTHEAMVEYDRRRVLKEGVLQTAVGTGVEMTLAVYALQGALAEASPAGDEPAWGPAAIELERGLLQADVEATRAALAKFIEPFRREPLLFPSLEHGGHPRQILRVRLAQNILRALVANLPRLGLLRETYDLLRTAHAMEQENLPAGRARTEFNQLFQVGYQAVVRAVVESAAAWPSADAQDDELLRLLERLTRPFVTLWVEHSQTMHLSVLETIRSEADWERVRDFIRRHGNDLFHVHFLTLANLRAVLHRGVGAYLDDLAAHPDPLHPLGLIEDLDQGSPRDEAVHSLELIIHALVEHYEEYKDYNASTPQSDYGANLYTLLDFLLLKTSYERRAWQFRPLALAHGVLTRAGRHTAAVRWQEGLAGLTRDVARQHLDRLAQLEQTHGMVLRTVRDRIEEQFVRPLALDRLGALVRPAMDEAAGGGPAWARFEQELRPYTDHPGGVGLGVPPWLERLGMEVQRVLAGRHTLTALAEEFLQVPRRGLSRAEVESQLEPQINADER